MHKTEFELKCECERLKQSSAIEEMKLNDFFNLKFDLTHWVYHRATGEFTNTDIDRDFDLRTKDHREIRSRAIISMIADGIIEPANKRHGVYRLRNKELKPMNFKDKQPDTFPIWLPFGIHRFVNIFPGNIIQVNGEKNSGKTAFMLNIIKNNMPFFDVHYFNSEMGGAELRKRLEINRDISLDQWRFNAYERASDFHQVLFPGENTINIIDFLEQHEDFWLMGKQMRDIHDNLDGSIGVVCVQLNKGAEQGLGGSRTEEKPRLILNISPGKLKIRMAKNWATSENPNGKMINFKLVNGCLFKPQGDWYEETSV